MNDQTRPNPDQILARLTQKDGKLDRGRLKIFFGSSAGVGKTYAMLKAAHEHKQQGLDVVVGIVETHKRQETADLLNNLPLLRPLEIKYRGLTLKEFDLDNALARRPDILLVDELAHTNAPGTRHPKRWNDVIELLDAGIDVYTTLNVQHIESLSDVIASSTGVWVKETIPDTVFDLADDVVLVDIDEDDLIQRLHEGKVYLSPGAMARAAENFFKKSNLGALREIALRRTADRVDAQRLAEGTDETLPIVAEKILVCIAADTMAHTLARTGKRLATGLKAHWEVLHIERPRLTDNEVRSNKFITQTERTIEHMGGRLTILSGFDVVTEILNYAHSNKFTKIIVGKDPRNSFRSFKSLFLINRLIKQSGGIDVYIVTAENDPLKKTSKEEIVCNVCWGKLICTTLMAGFFTIPSWIKTSLFTPTDQALIYLIGVVLVADRFGFLPSLFYTILAATAFHFFTLEPHYSYTLNDISYVINLCLMLLTSYIIATQAARLRAQTITARTRQKQTHDLLNLTRTLTSVNGRFPLAKLVAEHIKLTMGGETTVWMMNNEGHPSVILGDIPQATYYKEFGALAWCLENNQKAGHCTETLPSAEGTYFPLTTNDGVLGVLGYLRVDKEEDITNTDIETLETIATLLASALVRIKSSEGETTKPTTPDQQVDFMQTVNERIKENENHAKRTKQSTIDKNILNEIERMLDKNKDTITPSFDHGRKKILTEMPTQKIERHPTSIIKLINSAYDEIRQQQIPLSLNVDVLSNMPDVLADQSMMIKAIKTFLLDAHKHVLKDMAIQLLATRQENEVRIDIMLPVAPPLKHSHNQANLLNDLTADSLAKQNVIEMEVAIGIVNLHYGQAGCSEMINGKMAYYITLPLA